MLELPQGHGIRARETARCSSHPNVGGLRDAYLANVITSIVEGHPNNCRGPIISRKNSRPRPKEIAYLDDEACLPTPLSHSRRSLAESGRLYRSLSQIGSAPVQPSVIPSPSKPVG
jgi:hypothetical protein